MTSSDKLISEVMQKLAASASKVSNTDDDQSAELRRMVERRLSPNRVWLVALHGFIENPSDVDLRANLEFIIGRITSSDPQFQEQMKRTLSSRSPEGTAPQATSATSSLHIDLKGDRNKVREVAGRDINKNRTVRIGAAGLLALVLLGGGSYTVYRVTQSGSGTAGSPKGQAANLVVGNPCQKTITGTAVVGPVCFSIPQEYTKEIRGTDLLTAERYPPNCPNQNQCGFLEILAGNAYNGAFAGRTIGSPNQNLGLSFSKPLDWNSAGEIPSCSNHLTKFGTARFGSRTAEYRELTVNCSNSPQEQVKLWRIPESRILVVSEQPSALGSTSVQTMVAHATFISETPGVLPPPTQVSPQDGSVFNNLPRHTRYSWEAVSGAAAYVVQIQACNPAGCSASTSPSGPNMNLPPYSPTVTDTSYSQSFVGAQPGRWRVAALKPDGELGQFSQWWGFTHTR